MKKQIFKIAFVAIASLTAFSSMAENKSAISGEEPQPSSFKVFYLGTTKENNLVFDIKIANLPSDQFELVLTNDQGDVIYSNTFDSKKFDKKVMLKNEDQSINGSINFYVRPVGSKKILTQSYDISNQTSYVKNIVVKRM